MVELEDIYFFGGLNWIGRDRLCRRLVAGSLDGTSRGPTSSPLLAAQKSSFFCPSGSCYGAPSPFLFVMFVPCLACRIIQPFMRPAPLQTTPISVTCHSCSENGLPHSQIFVVVNGRNLFFFMILSEVTVHMWSYMAVILSLITYMCEC